MNVCMAFRVIPSLNLSFAWDMPLLAVCEWWGGVVGGVNEMGKEERIGGSKSPGEPGQALIFSLWQLPESFSRRAISFSYYNASLKHNPYVECLGGGRGMADGWKGRKSGEVFATSRAGYKR